MAARLRPIAFKSLTAMTRAFPDHLSKKHPLAPIRRQEYLLALDGDRSHPVLRKG